MSASPIAQRADQKNGPAQTSPGDPCRVLGTFDHNYWKQGTKTPHAAQDLIDNLHDFKQVLTFEPSGGWVEEEKTSSNRQIKSKREGHH